VTISEDISVPEKILINFKVKREDWNSFQLEDGSILKAKFVLINVLGKSSGKGFEGSLQSQNVLGVFAPADLRGKPSEPYTKEELVKSVVDDDVDVKSVISQPWNEYELDTGLLLKIKSMPLHIARTNKYDREGMPVYLVDTTAVVKGKMLKKPKTRTP
jgi:hypothetical protein